MYIHTVNNHTIKYKSISLVVGEAIAYKRVVLQMFNEINMHG